MITIRIVATILLGVGVALTSLSAQPQAKKDASKQVVIRLSPAEKYQEGLNHERGGRDAEAFESFLQAGEAGYGPAQRKLANIYDRGNRVIIRDYQSAIRWYERARVTGEDLPKPLAPIRGR
jgi:TPR repeat protein